MTKTLIAGLLFASGLAAAQTPDGAAPAATAAPAAPNAGVKKLDQDIRADRKEIRSDKSAIRQDYAAQKRQIADLNSQEKAAMDAVTGDTTLSKPAANAAKRKIHADFKAKKDAIRSQMKADRNAKRADIGSERGDIKKDVEERREILNGGK